MSVVSRAHGDNVYNAAGKCQNAMLSYAVTASQGGGGLIAVASFRDLGVYGLPKDF